MKNIDPKIKRLFPWGLFLFLAFIFAGLAISRAHGEEVRKPPSTWSSWSCDMVKSYLTTHTIAEARAEAVAHHVPQWIIRKAEKCI